MEAVITVADLGEFGLIAAIQAVLPPDQNLEVSAGDDAAVLRTPDGRVVATTDLLIEGKHFRLDWSSPSDVGVKAAAQNLADVAAMGAAPRTLLVGIACPGDLAVDWVLEMIGGMIAECQRAGASIAGGDVTAADSIMLGITALGDLAGRPPITRAGARPGDQLAVTGRLGWSAAGLALLQSGRADGLSAEMAALVTAHLRPQPDYLAGQAAALGGATAMVDVSDGLLQDLGHVAVASGVAIDLRTALIPIGDVIKAAGELLGADPVGWVFTGGEDHALAAAFPAEAAVPPGWRLIGRVIEGHGVLADGARMTGRTGWEHFR